MAKSFPLAGNLLASSLMLISLMPSALSYHIANSESGSISGGEVIHYTLSFTDPVVVVLISEEGDVDLYASPTHINSKPTSDDNEISSASCGMDMLALIMSSSLRKYTLGVHGHSRFDKSLFTLYVIKPSQEDIRSYQVLNVDVDSLLTFCGGIMFDLGCLGICLLAENSC